MDGVKSPSFFSPLPPTSEEDRIAWLRLLRSRRVGIATFYRLMREHGTAQAALAALPDVARAAGDEDYTVCPTDIAIADLRKAGKSGAHMICVGSDAYPRGLLDLDAPPPVLWVRGDPALLHRPAISIVGARNASSLGLRMARQLARQLGDAGYGVVSGLARGIDTAAHEASIDAGTVAVLGGGVDVPYPKENTKLYHQIAESGVLVSEQPMGLPPRAQHFPLRNRIIAGLGQAMVVVEAAAKSGSLISARDALDIGRDVMAVPGHPLDPRACGCNMLIRDGATLVRGADDVVDALAPIAQPLVPKPTIHAPRVQNLHAQILDRIGSSAIPEDQLIRDTSAPARIVARTLSDLELDGRIERKPGGLFTTRN